MRMPRTHHAHRSRGALLLLGELGAIVLRIRTGGAPDARKRGVEPLLSGPVSGCII